jgi:hypothetical protein
MQQGVQLALRWCGHGQAAVDRLGDLLVVDVGTTLVLTARS